MGKAKGGFLTPKAIANRIKAKGLQKLRWYCQMCQKQCRDENGFKCHLTSESHQRQLLLFADNPDEYIDGFSKEFLDDFTELLRRRYGTKRVHANIVYQEFIANKEHMHMNSTQWETLTEFVKWMGREGHAVVDETEKGWFITYIDRDWEAIKKQEDLQKKGKMDMDDEERTSRLIQKQIERAQATAKTRDVAEATELKRSNEAEKVAFNFSAGTSAEEKPSTSKSLPAKLNPFEMPKPSSGASSNTPAGAASKPPKVGEKRKSALGEIMELEEQKREKINRKDYWLHKDIVVKVVTKKLGDKYYNVKGVITSVVNLYTAVVKLIDCGTKIKVDQKHLETVIPALGTMVVSSIDKLQQQDDYRTHQCKSQSWGKDVHLTEKGREVKIVNGAYRGSDATLLELKEKKFCCTVKICSGPLQGRVLENIQYEDLSKLYKPS